MPRGIMYLIKTRYGKFPFDDLQKVSKYFSIAGSQVRQENDKLSWDWQDMTPGERKEKLYEVSLADLSEQELAVLQGHPDVISVERTKDGVFKDFDHEEEIIISDDGTRWESGDPL